MLPWPSHQTSLAMRKKLNCSSQFSVSCHVNSITRTAKWKLVAMLHYWESFRTKDTLFHCVMTYVVTARFSHDYNSVRRTLWDTTLAIIANTSGFSHQACFDPGIISYLALIHTKNGIDIDIEEWNASHRRHYSEFEICSVAMATIYPLNCCPIHSICWTWLSSDFDLWPNL